MYSNLIIYYFSGTGNARACARWLIDAAERKGMNTFLIKMDRAVKPEIPALAEGKTLVGFCYPTHGFNAAPNAISYIRKYPKLEGAKVFLLNTRAGMKIGKMFTPGLSGLALILPALILLLKGYHIVALKPVDLPSNWISLHPGLRKKVVDSLFSHWHKNVARFSNKLLDGKKVWRGLLDLPLDLLISPIAVGYYFMGRFCLAKTFIATDACTSCKKCVRECPVEALKMKGQYPFWTWRCESCMRCMNNCPERAIETAHGFAIPLWYVLFSFVSPAIFIWIMYENKMLAGLAPGLKELLYNLIFAALFVSSSFLGYRLIHYLMRFRLFNRFVASTSLTKYKFWRRYKAPEEFV